MKATVAVVLFSLVSSGQYMVNDVLDADEDRRHPRKRLRPVASGALTAPVALTVGGLLAAGGTAAAFVLEPTFGWVTAIYLATTVAYSYALKRVALLDVFVISAGFVLRTVAGAAVLEVPVSPWLYTCAGLGALFIALSKRRSELVNAGDRAPEQRETLDLYSRPLLDQLIGISSDRGLADLRPLHLHRTEPAGRPLDDADRAVRRLHPLQVHLPRAEARPGREPRGHIHIRPAHSSGGRPLAPHRPGGPAQGVRLIAGP